MKMWIKHSNVCKDLSPLPVATVCLCEVMRLVWSSHFLFAFADKRFVVLMDLQEFGILTRCLSCCCLKMQTICKSFGMLAGFSLLQLVYYRWGSLWAKLLSFLSSPALMLRADWEAHSIFWSLGRTPQLVVIWWEKTCYILLDANELWDLLILLGLQFIMDVGCSLCRNTFTTLQNFFFLSWSVNSIQLPSYLG